MTPRSFKRTSSVKISSISEWVRPAIDSSAIRSFGSAAMARANSSLRISTCVRSRGRCRAFSSSPTSRNRSWHRAVDVVGGADGAARRDGVEQRDAHIVDQTEAGERPRQLKAAGQSEMGALMRGQAVERPAIEAHRALLVAQRAADAIDQRRFAGTVRSDEAEPLARLDRQRDIFQRDEAAEPLAEIVDVKQLRHGTVPGASASIRRRPTKSSGLRCR